MKKKKSMAVPLIAASAVALAAIIALALVVVSRRQNERESVNYDPAPKDERYHVIPDEALGVYVPTGYNIAFPSRPDLSASELEAECDALVADVGSLGLNTLILQVRPECDAFYDSDIFPVSRWLSTDRALTYDVLDRIVKTAHEKNISVIAWVNPLRVSAGNATLDDLPDSSPVKSGTLSECVVSYGGRLYLDPARPEARDLVCRGVTEIVEKYEVDGILFDDYFYPYSVYETDENGNELLAVFDDAESYAAYGSEYDDVGDFRRNNVNLMISEVYDAIKAVDKRCRFGVAPFGIWKNLSGEDGSTHGLESYFELYCDTLAWCEAKTVDFIAPQIYWSLDSETASFRDLAAWWSKKLSGSGVSLLFSHAAYRYGEDFAPGEMTRQTELAKGLEGYAGSFYYSYAAFRDNLSGIRDEVTKGND